MTIIMRQVQELGTSLRNEVVILVTRARKMSPWGTQRPRPLHRHPTAENRKVRVVFLVLRLHSGFAACLPATAQSLR